MRACCALSPVFVRWSLLCTRCFHASRIACMRRALPACVVCMHRLRHLLESCARRVLACALRAPDGVEAAYVRLAALLAREGKRCGLAPADVDRRLWTGAAAAGWLVHALDGDGHYAYTAPSGRKCANKAEARAVEADRQMRVQAKQRK